MTGKAHPLFSLDLFLLQRRNGRWTVLHIEGVHPAVMADAALLRRIRLPGMIHGLPIRI